MFARERQHLALLAPEDMASYSITIQNVHFGSQSPAALYLSQLAPASQATQAQALATLAALLGHPDPLRCPWQALRPQHTLALRARLASRYAPATANRLLAALRGVLRAARRLRLMSADDERAAGDVPPVRGQTLLRGRALSREELRALLRVCAADAGPAGRRDAALLALGYAGGLRRAEIVALDLVDYDAPTGRVTIRHGKGNKARTVYVAGGWGRLIEAWLQVRGSQAGPLLLAISKAGRILDRRLAPPAVRWLLRRESTRRQSPVARRTTYAAAASATCSTLALISPRHSASLATPQWPPPHATTDGVRLRNSERRERSTSLCRSSTAVSYHI